MKKQIPGMVLLLAMLCTQNSFANNDGITDRVVDSKKAKETTTSCFIQKKDGSIQNFTSLQLVTGVFKTPHLLAEGKIKIDAKDVLAYQNNEHYAVSDANIEGERKAKVAIGALPGFAVRIAKGKLNVYSRKYFNGKNAVDELFIQDGNNGKIVAYTPELMASILKEHPEALQALNNKGRYNNLAIQLQAVANIYNQDQLISKN
jgi:hypothetical protein